MHWVSGLSCFLGGAILVNAIPHLVSGLTGRPFQTPFAKPPGKGLSSSTVNVLWGFFNLAAGGILVGRVGHLDAHATEQVVTLALGGLLAGLGLARTFGRLHGGDLSGGA